MCNLITLSNVENFLFEDNSDCDEGSHPSHQALAILIYTMPHMVCCKVPKHTSHTLAIMVRHRMHSPGQFDDVSIALELLHKPSSP